jgi:hypothetical protein
MALKPWFVVSKTILAALITNTWRTCHHCPVHISKYERFDFVESVKTFDGAKAICGERLGSSKDP